MEFLKVLKRKKLLFLNIFFLLYISINLFTGERGLISYFEKKTLLSNLNNEKGLLVDELQSIENKNNLLSKDDRRNTCRKKHPSRQQIKRSSKRTNRSIAIVRT